MRRQSQPAGTAQGGRASHTPRVRGADERLKRQHPAALFSYAGGFFFTAAAPAAALLPLMLTGRLPIGSLLFTLAPLAVYCAVCTADWRTRVWAASGALTDCGGLAVKHAVVIAGQNISCVRLTRTPALGAVGAVRLTVTDVCRTGRDRTFAASAREGSACARSLTGCSMRSGEGRQEYSLGSAALAALSGSNFASGLLLVIPAAVRLGKIAGQALDRRLYAELGQTAAELLPGLPSVYALPAALLALGWAVHFLANFLSGARHTAYCCDGCTVIAAGALTRRVTVVPNDAVSVLETRRTLLMSALGMCSCHVRTIGGRHETCLVPPQKSRRLTRIRAAFFPRPEHTGAVVRPNGAHLRLYSQSWYLFSFAFAALWAVTGEEHGVLSLIPLAAAVVFMWRALVGLAASRSAKVRVCAEFVELSGVGGLCARTWRISRQTIARITVSRSPFDLLRGTCMLIVYASGMSRPARCSYLPYERTRALCERLCQ